MTDDDMKRRIAAMPVQDLESLISIAKQAGAEMRLDKTPDVHMTDEQCQRFIELLQQHCLAHFTPTGRAS